MLSYFKEIHDHIELMYRNDKLITKIKITQPHAPIWDIIKLSINIYIHGIHPWIILGIQITVKLSGKIKENIKPF